LLLGVSLIYTFDFESSDDLEKWKITEIIENTGQNPGIFWFKVIYKL